MSSVNLKSSPSLGLAFGAACLLLWPNASVMAKSKDSQPVSSITIVIAHPGEDNRSQTYKEANPWLDLEDGDVATVTEDTQVDTITGPFHGRLKVARKSGGARIGFSAQVANVKAYAQNKVRAEKANPSSESEGSRLPQGLTLADISLDTDEKQCLLPDSHRLWRTDVKEGGDIILSQIGGRAQKLEAHKNDAFIKWPNQVTATNDEQEWVVSRLGTDGVTHRFTLVKLSLDKPLSLERLVEKGCMFQAKIAAELSLK